MDLDQDQAYRSDRERARLGEQDPTEAHTTRINRAGGEGPRFGKEDARECDRAGHGPNWEGSRLSEKHARERVDRVERTDRKGPGASKKNPTQVDVPWCDDTRGEGPGLREQDSGGGNDGINRTRGKGSGFGEENSTEIDVSRIYRPCGERAAPSVEDTVGRLWPGERGIQGGGELVGLSPSWRSSVNPTHGLTPLARQPRFQTT